MATIAALLVFGVYLWIMQTFEATLGLGIANTSGYWRCLRADFFSGLAIVFELLVDEYLFGVHMDLVPRVILLSDGALKRLHLKWLRQVDMM